MSALPKFAFYHRGMLVAIPLVPAIACTRYECQNEVMAWLVGGILFCLGLAIRIWAQQHLRYRLKIKKVLTCTGPYALMRNPIYIGNSLICIAITVASRELWVVPITILMCCLVFPLVVKFEEAQLTKKYGELYLDYQREVPRWIPKFSKMPKLQLTSQYLPASMWAEAHNLLFIIPLLVKAMIVKS